LSIARLQGLRQFHKENLQKVLKNVV
jgi:hypothetical protein